MRFSPIIQRTRQNILLSSKLVEIISKTIKLVPQGAQGPLVPVITQLSPGGKTLNLEPWWSFGHLQGTWIFHKFLSMNFRAPKQTAVVREYTMEFDLFSTLWTFRGSQLKNHPVLKSGCLLYDRQHSLQVSRDLARRRIILERRWVIILRLERGCGRNLSRQPPGGNCHSLRWQSFTVS